MLVGLVYQLDDILVRLPKYMSPKETTKRQPCEVYSRVNGYLRPVKQWNDAKTAEFEDRLEYKGCNC